MNNYIGLGSNVSAASALKPKGTWNANTNVPDLTILTPDTGDFWVVSVSGATLLGGVGPWTAGDWAVYIGGAWSKVDNAVVVSSVFTRTGAVVAATGDYSKEQITGLTILDSPRFAAVQTGFVYPIANGTSAFQIRKADGLTNIVNIDSTNSRVGIGIATPQAPLDIAGSGEMLRLGTATSAATPRVYLRSMESGYAAPSSAGAFSDGDKWIFWNVTNVYKGAIGFDSGEMWFQSTRGNTGNALFRWYLGWTNTPQEIMKITGAGTGSPRSQFIWNDDATDADFRCEGTTDANLLLLDASTNRVGIGIAAPLSKLHINGSHGQKVSTFTSTPQTLDVTHNIVLGNMGSALTVNLPTAVGCGDRVYTIKNINTGTLTVTPNGAETIDGAASYALAQWESIVIVSNGANWFII